MLVLREVSERPEAITVGADAIVGTQADNIVSKVGELLHQPEIYHRMARSVNRYGDGCASTRIADAQCEFS